MANELEYQLSYTGSEIDSKLATIDIVASAFEDVNIVGNNVLDPNNSELGDFSRSEANLIVGQELVHLASSVRYRSIAPISVPSDKTTFYVRTSIESDDTGSMILIYCLDENKGYISTITFKFSILTATQTKYESNSIPDNCRYIHVVVTGVSTGHDFSKVCISYNLLDDFEAYICNNAYVLKESSLPDSFSGMSEQIQDLSYQISGIKPKLHGKVVVNFGDSITDFEKDGTSVSGFIAEYSGATTYNVGFAGCRMSTHTSDSYAPYSMCNLADAIASGDFTPQENAGTFVKHVNTLKTIDFSAVDIITIAYGTNDFTGDVVLDNETNATDKITFGGSLRHSIETVLTAYPNLRIALVAPTWRYWMNDDGSFKDDSDTRSNSNNNKLHDFVDKMKEIANKYHIPVVNPYDEMSINRFNYEQWFRPNDGTHPSSQGQEMYAKLIVKTIEYM